MKEIGYIVMKKITKKMIGDSDSSTDSDQEEDYPASNSGMNQVVRRQKFYHCQAQSFHPTAK